MHEIGIQFVEKNVRDKIRIQP